VCDRIHITVLNAFYRVAFRKKFYTSIATLEEDLDEWVGSCNEAASKASCFGKTPWQTFFHAIPIARVKMIAA